MTLRDLIRGRAGGLPAAADEPGEHAAAAPTTRMERERSERVTRLDLGDCLKLLGDMHAALRAEYEGGLELLNGDPDLARRFRETEDRIDALGSASGGPTRADFCGAVEAHAAVWREIIARFRAQREQRAERSAVIRGPQP